MKQNRRENRRADRDKGPEAGYQRTGYHRTSQKLAKRKKEQRLLLDLIRSKNYKPMRAKDIAFLLDVPKAKMKDMLEVLDALVAEHKIRKDGEDRFEKVMAGSDSETEGHFQHRSENRGGFSDSGRTRERAGRHAQQNEDKAIRAAIHRLDPSDPASALTEVVLEYGVPMEFPAKVLEQADRFPVEPQSGDYTGRLDLRNKRIITIDGDDSRDFDDAVSLERDGSGYILGVHIADVTNYVAAGSALDKEALKRGTSVYLADRVIPMLPEKLSNGLCSLNEGEDRLTLSCIVKMDREGNIRKSRIVESVICSSHRMTYSEVDRIFAGSQDTKDNHAEEPQDLAALREKYADVLPMLFDMRDLAGKLEKQRHDRGMIDFDFPETKISLDEKGNPVRVFPSYPTPATKLIEQFMLTANEVVAKTYFDKHVPFLYRTHESPDDEKIESTLKVVHAMGISAEKAGQHITPREVQRIISNVEGTGRESMVSSMLLRSMQQARYTPENGGHFGLASGYYCHFTSPIRRYPDLQIHRIIKDDLHGNLSARKISWYERIMEDVAWKSSALERRSVEVERETTKIEMARYISGHLGEVTPAQVTGVTGWGIYVQRPDTIEGLVHVSTLKGDYYVFDERNMTLTGRSKGRTFEIGQTLRVKAVRADVRLRQIDFEIVEEAEEESRDGKREGNKAGSQ
ncbi:MAG: ribonuclease R [Eubacterium sp.]|nr:ribonuclease R [Eubacterium sp.]